MLGHGSSVGVETVKSYVVYKCHTGLIEDSARAGLGRRKEEGRRVSNGIDDGQTMLVGLTTPVMAGALHWTRPSARSRAK